MFTVENLNPLDHPTTSEIIENLQVLALSMNRIEIAYGRDLSISSGLRSWGEHCAIYERINAARKVKGLTPLKIPKKSKHLIGAAVDIIDPLGLVWRFCMSNIALLEEVGLWLEDRSATPTWVHFQRFPPASRRRIFKP